MKNIFYFIAFNLLYSCENPDNKVTIVHEDFSQNTKEINLLKKDKANLAEQEIQLKEQINEKNKEIAILEEKEANSLYYLKLSSEIIFNKNKLTKEVFEALTGSWNQGYNTLLANLSIVVNPNRNKDFISQTIYYINRSKDSRNYLFYLWFNFDRSANNIKHFFTNENKDYIYSLFNDNDKYEKAGIEALVKALLISHDEIYQDNQLLERLYNRSKTISPIGDVAYFKIASPQIKELLSDNLSDDPIIHEYTRYGWVYSFWVRRHQENNSAVVYELIKEFDEQMSPSNEYEEDYN